MKAITLILSIFILQAQAENFTNFLERYCIDCHDEDIQKGDLQLDNFKFSQENFDIAEKMIEVIESHDMPPKKKKKQPTLAERHEAMETLDHYLSSKAVTGNENIRKLTLREYSNTINDTLGTNFSFDKWITAEAKGEHFNNIGRNQFISVNDMAGYLKAAREISKNVIVHDKPAPATIKTAAKSMSYGTWDKYFQKQDFVKVSHVANGATGVYNSTHQIQHPGTYRITVKAQTHNFKKHNKYLSINTGDPQVHLTYKKIATLPVHKKLTSTSVKVDLQRGDKIIINMRESDENPTEQRVRYDLKKSSYAAVHSMKIEGPFYKDWPPLATKKVFGNSDISQIKNYREHVSKILKIFIPKNPNQINISNYYQLYLKSLRQTKDPVKSLQIVMQTVLCSADFLYRTEKAGSLDNFDLAKRLSYFLWGTSPDKQLLNLANQGALKNLEVYQQQLSRMLKDKRTDRFLNDFTSQWLWLHKVGSMMANKHLYFFPDHVKEASKQESLEFVKEIFRSNLSITNFIDSDFIMINKHIGQNLYGISRNNTEQKLSEKFEKYKLPEGDHRGGLLSQASFLNMTSDGEQSSPILRGVWILKNIYGTELEPPAAVPAIEPDIRGAKTVKEVLKAHQEQSSCYRCHAKIDPLGLALENYNAVGSWQNNYKHFISFTSAKEATKKFVKKSSKIIKTKELPIITKTTLENGTTIKTPQELKKAMLKDSPKIAKAFIKKLLTYAMGRKIEHSEKIDIEKIYQDSKARGLGLRDVILACLKSDTFMQN